MNIFNYLKKSIKEVEKKNRQKKLLEKIEKINEERRKKIEEKNRLQKEKLKIEEDAKITAEEAKEEKIILNQLRIVELRLQELESERKKLERELISSEKEKMAESAIQNEKQEIETTENAKKTIKEGREQKVAIKLGVKNQTEQIEKKTETETAQTESFWEKLEKIKAAEKRKEIEIDEKAASRLTGAKKIAALLGKTLKSEKEEEEKAKEKEIILASSQLAVDLYKNPSEIIVFAQLPGVEIKDLDISIEGQNDIIKIKAQSQRPEMEKTEKEGRFALSECKWPSYYRELNLEEEINVFGIDAKLKNGVLVLRLPIIKPGQSRTIKRKIEVKQ